MTTTLKPTCLFCQYYEDLTGNCPAYPEGIPDDIWSDLEPHTELREGQEGDYIFRLIKELTEEFNSWQELKQSFGDDPDEDDF